MTPIGDAPAADYVNQDGVWGGVLLGGGRLRALVTLQFVHSVLLGLAGCPEAQEVGEGSSEASKATHHAQAR